MLESALKGLRVVELSQGIAGPHAALLMAEMGAEVIKVEPPQGDWLRNLGVRRGSSSVLYGYFNRGKKNVRLDLKLAAAKDAALALIESADVLIESSRPGAMARLGLDFPTLSMSLPRLVYLSITGFGQRGPYARRPATDAVVQAYTGLSFGAGDMVTPVRVRVSLVDVVSGVYACNATLGALLQRGVTGKGQHLDLSLMHASSAMQGYKYAEHVTTGGELGGELFPGIGLYKTQDGFIAISANRESHVTTLLDLCGRGDALQNPLFGTPEARFANQAELRLLIGAQLLMHSSAHWAEKLGAADLICAPVLNYDAFLSDPQVLDQQIFQKADIGTPGVQPVVRMPGIRPAGFLAERTAMCGEHTREVLAGAGVGADAIERLIAA